MSSTIVMTHIFCLSVQLRDVYDESTGSLFEGTSWHTRLIDGDAVFYTEQSLRTVKFQLSVSLGSEFTENIVKYFSLKFHPGSPAFIRLVDPSLDGQLKTTFGSQLPTLRFVVLDKHCYRTAPQSKDSWFIDIENDNSFSIIFSNFRASPVLLSGESVIEGLRIVDKDASLIGANISQVFYLCQASDTSVRNQNLSLEIKFALDVMKSPSRIQVLNLMA